MGPGLPRFCDQILPLDSAETLISLQFEAEHLDLTPFHNLQTIGFRFTAVQEIVQCLEELDVHLETFDFWLEEIPDPLSTSLFSVPALSHLQRLILGVDFDGGISPLIGRVCAPIWTLSRPLRRIWRMYETWCLFVWGWMLGGGGCLSRLRELESIVWEIDPCVGILEEGSPAGAVEKAFEAIEAKPKMRVEFRNYSRSYGPKSRWTYDDV
jgi:hypothetical protein